LSLACSLAAVADVAVASGNATIQIAPGVFMPMISVGHPDDGKRNETAAALAWLRAGGRGIDTALDYHNQAQVGAALRASGVARADVFVTTKIPCQPGTESAASKAIREDLAQLELPYVDLLLIHFPCKRTVETQNVWRALQSAHANGLARAIGVSNFERADLDGVLSIGGTPPAINQCQMSIGSHDDTTRAYGLAHNITYEAYSPLRHVDLTDSRLTAIATHHAVSSAQVALRWIYQQGVTIATSPGTSATFIQEDLALGSFALTDDEMTTLAQI